jgi:hypothetical protein
VKTKHMAFVAITLLMSVAAQAAPIVVSRPAVMARPVVAPHVSVSHAAPAAHVTPATHVAAVPRINPANAEAHAVPHSKSSAAQRHAAHVKPALPVINVPAPLRKRCADQASRECQQ